MSSPPPYSTKNRIEMEPTFEKKKTFVGRDKKCNKWFICRILNWYCTQNMPPVGGFVALCVTHRDGRTLEAPKTKLYGDFFKIDFTPNSNTITGKLMINFNAYRICHGGIKVRLEGHLELMGKNAGQSSACKSIDIFEQCPVETLLSCGDLLHGQKRLTFNLSISPHRPHPTPFMTSNGSLTYRMVALIHRDDSWEVFAKKLVHFKGYHNVLHLGLNPFVETKIMRIETGELVSTFRVPNTVAVMGQRESLEAILELYGALECQVNAKLTFFRNISYGQNIHTEIISSQNRQAEIHQNNAVFKWTCVVPMMKRSSYSNQLVPMYSVRHYLKYEVFLGQLDVEEAHPVVSGVVQVEIGTSRDPSETYDHTNGSANHNNAAPQTDRRKSVMSLVSMLSLPPAYSQLVSRSGSMMSLETQPPGYDDLESSK